jgi:beta-glucosidase
MAPRTDTPFPDHFWWGAATSSYQIEGAPDANGKSESIWDRFTHLPGKIEDGTNGDVACDHYHRSADDLDLLASLGLRAYRFSIAWPRVVPAGRGQVNTAGLDFYDRLVDGLLARDVEPFVTLYHWDAPAALEDAGGWPARDIVDAFADYTEAVTARLGDRVTYWVTLNEPWVSSFMGYAQGLMAPGDTQHARALASAHHQLLAHGRSVEVIRSNVSEAKVGLALNLAPIYPASDSEEDVAAAHRFDGYLNRWFLDPLFRGAYPADLAATWAPDMPTIEPGDHATIAAAIDFLGVNYYTREVVHHEPGSGPVDTAATRVPGAARSMLGWETYPQGLSEVLRRLHRDYEVPSLIVTENGFAESGEEVDDEGGVDDQARIAYIRGHLLAIGDAIADGVPVDGYLVWTLMDNFEWFKGYVPQFGLVHVDRSTLVRTPKQSARWYRSVIEANGRSL